MKLAKAAWMCLCVLLLLIGAYLFFPDALDVWNRGTRRTIIEIWIGLGVLAVNVLFAAHISWDYCLAGVLFRKSQSIERK